MDSRLLSSGRISIVDGEKLQPTTLFFVKPCLADSAQACIKGVNNLSRLLKLLECGNGGVISIITSKTKRDYPYSMYDIEEYSSEYQVLRDRYSEFSFIDRSLGTDEQWTWLLKIMDL